MVMRLFDGGYGSTPRSGYLFEVLSFEVFLAVELLLSERKDLPLLLPLQFTQFLTSLLLQRQQILILIRHAPAGTPPIRRRGASRAETHRETHLFCSADLCRRNSPCCCFCLDACSLISSFVFLLCFLVSSLVLCTASSAPADSPSSVSVHLQSELPPLSHTHTHTPHTHTEKRERERERETHTHTHTHTDREEREREREIHKHTHHTHTTSRDTHTHTHTHFK